MRNSGVPYNEDFLRIDAGLFQDIDEVVNFIPDIDSNEASLLKVVSLLDLTSLNATDTPDIIEVLIKRAKSPVPGHDVKVAAVCVYAPFVEQACTALEHTDVEVATVAGGFPSGQMALELKCAEIELAIKLGATEVDAVIRRTYPLMQNWLALYEEVKAFRKSCKDVHLKVIMATGELPDPATIFKTSMTCLMAGADVIKTSTGMEKVNATLDAGYIMMQAIKRYEDMTGFKAGLKPAGGIRTTEQSLRWLELVRKLLGESWLQPSLFRIGASSLLDDLLLQLGKSK
jgi:deoxyribose-phosphate aldolase